MRRSPAGAMLRHNDIGVEFLQCLNSWRDDRLEDRTREVESTDDGVYATYTREISRMLQRVHDACMTATGQDNQTLIFHVDDHRLIVVNQWVRLPLAVDPGDLGRVSFLKGCGSRDLSRDERVPVHQHRRRPVFDDLDALGLQIALAWRDMLGLVPVGKNIFSFEERIRMQDDRYPWPAVAFNQSDHPSRMIRVPVAEHDGMQLIGLYLEGVHIVQHTVDGYPRIEEE